MLTLQATQMKSLLKLLGVQISEDLTGSQYTLKGGPGQKMALAILGRMALHIQLCTAPIFALP